MILSSGQRMHLKHLLLVLPHVYTGIDTVLFSYDTHSYNINLRYISVIHYFLSTCLMRRVINLREDKSGKFCLNILQTFSASKGGGSALDSHYRLCKMSLKLKQTLTSHTARQIFSLISFSHTDLTQTSKASIKQEEGNHSSGQSQVLGYHINAVHCPKTLGCSRRSQKVGCLPGCGRGLE